MKFNQDQTDSIVRKVLAVVGGVLATNGLPELSKGVTATSTEQVVTGIVLAVIAFWASHKSNADPSSPPVEPPIIPTK